MTEAAEPWWAALYDDAVADVLLVRADPAEVLHGRQRGAQVVAVLAGVKIFQRNTAGDQRFVRDVALVPAGMDRKGPQEAGDRIGHAGMATEFRRAGILAVGASKDYDDLKKTFPVSRQALDDQRSTVRTYSVIADVCIVGAIAAGGYSAYKLISWKPNEKKGEAPKTNAFVAPTPTGGMVGVGGVF